jgi:hypothetical protein
VNKKNQLLASLLAFQLSFALLLWWRDIWPQAETVPVKLLELVVDEIDTVSISAGKESVQLRREADSWTIAGDEVQAANSIKVQGLLQQLAALQARWPVADSVDSARRFEVAESNAQRRIEIVSGGESTVLLLGTSPAMRKVHARRAGQQAIYSLEFAHYLAPAQASDWLLPPEPAPASVDEQIAPVETKLAEPGAASGSVKLPVTD